jgi:polyhydroxyalkanoate synthesis repressor PhaR
MEDILIIKRYTNRRLYDTEKSEYINIGQFIERIKSGRIVAVRDSKTGRDLTRETLLQALVEMDKQGKILPEWVIIQMIKYRSRIEGNIYLFYLEKAFQMYFQMLDAILSGEQKVSPFDSVMNPLKKFADMLGIKDTAGQQNKYNVYQDSQRESHEKTSLTDEILKLKNRLEELEKKIR